MRPIKNRRKNLAAMMLSNAKKIRVFNLYDVPKDNDLSTVVEYRATGETLTMMEIYYAMDRIDTGGVPSIIHPSGKLINYGEFVYYFKGARQESVSCEEFLAMQEQEGCLYTKEKEGAKQLT